MKSGSMERILANWLAGKGGGGGSINPERECGKQEIQL